MYRSLRFNFVVKVFYTCSEYAELRLAHIIPRVGGLAQTVRSAAISAHILSRLRATQSNKTIKYIHLESLCQEKKKKKDSHSLMV